MEAGTGRDLQKRGRDGPRQMTYHSSWHWQETFTAPRLLSLPPSSSAVPVARPSPTQEQVVGASMLLSNEASQVHGSSHVQPTETGSSRSCVLLVHSVRDGWEPSFLTMGDWLFLAGSSCLPNHLHFAPQPAPTGRHARAAPSPAGAS